MTNAMRIGIAILLAALLAGGCIGAEIGPGGAEAGVGVGPFKVLKAEAGPGGVEAR